MASYLVNFEHEVNNTSAGIFLLLKREGKSFPLPGQRSLETVTQPSPELVHLVTL